MKILSFVHGYPPDHNAGAEWMIHDINKYLLSQGHEIKVMTRSGSVTLEENGKRSHKILDDGHTFEGIEVVRNGSTSYGSVYRWADIVITHLDWSGKAMNLCRAYNKPLVHLLHNTHHNDVIYRINPQNNYLVYNAEWNKKASKYINDSIVVTPPIDPEYYEVRSKRKDIVLVNCWEPKGGNVLIDLAKAMPKESFLGVKGGYGNQVIGKEKNLRYEKNTPEIKAVYRKAKIVLMPSVYESWGKVAVEAMCSGIPVIAHPTPGLKESLGDAGIFANRENIGEWVEAIEKLNDEEYYKEVSKKCKDRANELGKNSKKQLANLNKFLEKINRKGYV